MPLILLIIGLVLIIYSYRAIKREDKLNKENDSLSISFRGVLEDSKEELNDYKIEIGKLRRDMAESLTELQEEILDIKNNLNVLKNGKEIYDNKENLEIINSLSEDELHTKSNNETKSVDYLIDDMDEKYSVSIPVEDQEVHENNVSENIDSNKTHSIKKLLKEGLTEEEICHELSVSKGEVLLVKGLFKK
ncbi:MULTISPECIES: hypothetical protein [unclassified Clostridium]|uniref:hypothetical protein n=1 Tax=unclassified Clostridium TaxID=2614128 RepID=UPI000297BE28|nr:MULTISPECIES: hypothetical protein [unclassified Clostridium]EKQ51071.1 MAG: hypothetical protein A370_05097 [Clostridium sp. Maddingley MBC34-26]